MDIIQSLFEARKRMLESGCEREEKDKARNIMRAKKKVRNNQSEKQNESEEKSQSPKI